MRSTATDNNTDICPVARNVICCCEQPDGSFTLAVRYTPGQMRSAVGISQQTYRHWKKTLAPMRREAGHSPCFTAGDLIAVAVLRVLASDFAIRVSALSTIAESLFDDCNTAPWPVLERGKFVVELTSGRLQFLPELDHVSGLSPVLIIPLRPMIEQLRDALLTEGKLHDQELLRFPPTPITSTIEPRSTRGCS